MDMSYEVIRVAERDEPDVLRPVAEDLCANRAHPPRDAVEQVVERAYIVGHQIPEGTHVVAMRTWMKAAGVEMVAFVRSVLHELFDFANTAVVGRRVTDHQHARERFRALNQLLGIL